MLKMPGIELDLISDIDMHLFIEKGITGDIYYMAKRYSNQIINTCNAIMLRNRVNL